jgi:DNA-binding CsgD family transcriptional regulator
VNHVPAAPGAVHPLHDASAAVGPPPTQRSPQATSATLLRAATVLLADPRPATRVPLSVGLRGSGIGSVLEAASVAEVDEVTALGLVGDVALVSVEFGPVADRLIQDLRRTGWTRVLATTPTADPRPVIGAFRAGACGLLRGPPGTPAADTGPIPVHHLTVREIAVIRLVADGRNNSWIGDELNLSALTVKSHLARIGRKLGTGDRAHTVAVAMRAGLIR